MRTARFSLPILLLAATLGLAGIASAAETYPDRPITLLVPYKANSDTDHAARNLAAHIGKYLNGADVVPENRPGASGTTAAISLVGAVPDGYTLMLGRTGSQVISPALDHALPYRWNDFTYLGTLAIDPQICIVRSATPYKTARELLAAVRKAPGTIKFGTAGVGSIQNLTAHYLLKLNGLKPGAATPVHFDSAKDAVDALLAGQLDFVCTNAGVALGPIDAGNLRPLFTTAPGRMSELPALQNAREVGMRDMGNLLGWSVLVGPRNMPAPVVERWKKALKQLAHDPNWIAGTTARGGIPALGTAKDSEKFVMEQFEMFDHLISALNLRQ